VRGRAYRRGRGLVEETALVVGHDKPRRAGLLEAANTELDSGALFVTPKISYFGLCMKNTK
jgi:hypothetical protein